MQWSLLLGGNICNLSLTTREDGSVTGALPWANVAGLWDHDSQTLTVTSITRGEQADSYGLYRGHRFSVETEWGAFEAMAGTLETFTEPYDTEDNEADEVGWFAILREMGGNTHGASKHLWTTLRTQLPRPSDLDASLVMVSNGYVGPMSILGEPDTSHSGPVRAELFDQAGDAFSHGTVTATWDGAPRRMRLLRPSTDPSSDGTDCQVYRGGALLVGLDPDENQPEGPGPLGGHPAFISGWAGSFTALTGTGGRPGRTDYGWFAVRASAGL